MWNAIRYQWPAEGARDACRKYRCKLWPKVGREAYSHERTPVSWWKRTHNAHDFGDNLQPYVESLIVIYRGYNITRYDHLEAFSSSHIQRLFPKCRAIEYLFLTLTKFSNIQSKVWMRLLTINWKAIKLLHQYGLQETYRTKDYFLCHEL